MKKQDIIPLVLLFILSGVFLVVPVAAAGLFVTDGMKINTTYGATSPVITITDSPVAQDGTITIDLSIFKWFVEGFTPTDSNIIISDTAAAATWTGTIDSTTDTLVLTSTDGPTAVGENITVTFTGAVNPWISDSGGEQTIFMPVTRTDGLGDGTITFVIETAPDTPHGLSITKGAKITTPVGATTSEITITESPIAEGGSVTIDMTNLQSLVASGTLTSANIGITDSAAAATWTRSVTGNILTLTSTGGPTAVGETVTVTFTGDVYPWISDTGGEQTAHLTATRSDGLGFGYFDFVIQIVPPGSFTATDCPEITETDGSTLTVITLRNTEIVQDGTITINISGLNPFVVGHALSTDDVLVTSDAATARWTGAVNHNILTLTSTGGPTAVGETVTVTFNGAGEDLWIPDTGKERTALLTATRTDTGLTNSFSFSISTGAPVTNFSASPVSDIVPVTITFSDMSTGNPTSWRWDFGDGSISTGRNPVHTYTSVGTYTVSLNATNSRGTNSKVRVNYISGLNGAVREASTAMSGLTIPNCRSSQTVTVDTSVLATALIPNSSVLEIQPPAGSGFKNITLYALNGVGFLQNGNLITGKPTGVHLVTEEIAPSTGFSNETGANSSFNFSMDLSNYPCNARISTKIWEGVIPEFDSKFQHIASENYAFPVGTAYTARVTKTNFPAGNPVKLHMSINSTWNSLLTGGPGQIFIWQISDDGKTGQILPTTYLYTDPGNNLDYYEADSPHGGSVFGISSLTGSNNPFQLISFVAAQAINAASGGGSSKAVVAETTSVPEITPPVSPDPGKTAKIYSNGNGVISQQTILTSTDGFANISLGPGVVAKDSSGSPLSSISITRVADDNLPAGSPGADLSFTGLAYEIQPDEVTFSPSVPVVFTIPKARWGQEYVMGEYDHATGTWKALESSYDPKTNVITTYISHLCCFALFAKNPAIENTPNPTPTTTIIIASKSSMSTNVEMYSWIIAVIRQNPVIIVIIAAIIGGIAFFRWWKRRL